MSQGEEKDLSPSILGFWFEHARSHLALQFLMLLASAGTAAVLTVIIAAVFLPG